MPSNIVPYHRAKPGDRVQITLQLPFTLVERVRMNAADEDRTMTIYIKRILEAAINGEQK